MGAPNEFTMDDVKAALAKVSDQVKEAGEKALAEAKKHGDMYAADKPKVDEMLLKQGELQARLQEIERKASKREEPADLSPKTAGQILVESDEFKAYVAARNYKARLSVQINAAITSLTTSAGPLVSTPQQWPGILPLAQRRLTVRDLLSQGQTSQPSIQYRRELVYTNNAAPVSETNQKPESNITFDDQTARVIKLAHFIKASSEILDDAPALQTFVETRLRYGLALVEENQLLKGSGVGNNLNGIYTQATAYSAPIVVAAPTKIDVLRLMLLQADLAEFPSDGIVLHPSDWAVIELKKDSQGRYIIGNPQGAIQPMLWNRPVVPTQAMTVDTALVGSFKMGATVLDRKQAAITVSSENEDDFVKNLVTILAEERLALIVWRPGAFIKNADLPAT